MRIDELDYHLPEELIATAPAHPRDHARLLVYSRSTRQIHHLRFYDLPRFLLPSDMLVVNDTRVLPAKLLLQKPTGSRIPGLFLHEESLGIWTVMLRSRGRVSVGDTLLPLDAASPYRFTLLDRTGDKGQWTVRIDPPHHAPLVLNNIGTTPLPPYIERARGDAVQDEASDRQEYQTVYANTGQSVAAPTAGLHFTPQLLDQLHSLGIRRHAVNLEVGLGTFLPVETATLEEHKMHTETYEVPAATITALRDARQNQNRIVVVGTTAVRTLEAAAPQILALTPPSTIRGQTNICIQPGHTFQLTDALITNFHLPRSTLMALVAALIGLEELHRLYAEAVQQKYRFYSYGDAMLLLP